MSRNTLNEALMVLDEIEPSVRFVCDRAGESSDSVFNRYRYIIGGQLDRLARSY